jgi:hypothetical protein
VKFYYRHLQCHRRHRSYRALARCTWPKADWIRGDAPYAVLSHCRGLTVTLHETAAEAFAAKQRIDGYECGSRCVGEHEVVHLASPIEPRAKPTSPALPDTKARSTDNLYDKQRSRLKLKK